MPFALVRCSLNGALPEGFRLTRESLGDKLLQLVGSPDHQLGDPELDSTFLLERVDGEVRRVLADRVARERLLALVAKYPGMRIGRGVLQLEVERLLDSEGALAELLGDAVSLALTLQRAKARG